MSSTSASSGARRARVASGAITAAVIALCAFCAWAAGAREHPGEQLARRLRSAGRAVARFERSAGDPISGGAIRSSGLIALELPDRALLRFEGTGERVALRGDGGEWLQPRLHQMLLLDAERAAAVRVWWGVLMGGGVGPDLVRRTGERRFTLYPPGSGGTGSDSAQLVLDRAGLPATLDVVEGGARSRYRFSGWSFSRPRGRAAFELRAPAGFDVVRLP